MLSYMLPTGNKPPPGEQSQNYNRARNSMRHDQQIMRNSTRRNDIENTTSNSRIMTSSTTHDPFIVGGTSPMSLIDNEIVDNKNSCPTHDRGRESPKHQNGNGILNSNSNVTSINNMTTNSLITTTTTATTTMSTTTTATRKSTLHTSSRVTKDDSLHSIDSEASTVGSDRKGKIINGAKHASLKRSVLNFSSSIVIVYLSKYHSDRKTLGLVTHG